MSVEQARLARAYLLRVAEPPARELAQLVTAHGPVAAAELVRSGQAPGRVRAETEARAQLDRAERDLEEAAAVGAELVIPEDDGWPAWPLLALDVAARAGVRWAGQPLGLWVRGRIDLDACTERAVALVGARASSGYGDHHAAEFAYGLTGRGFTVLSGAAYGIDGAAHRGSLAAGGPTIAVLGCGPDVHYPAGHVRLLDQVAEQGAVVSEYPPGTQPARHRFLVRNRLIAALASGTVVIEAGARSGARNTASTAGALGKVVMAVPGPVSSASSAGCNQLIRARDALLVSGVAEIVEAVGPIGSAMTTVDGPRRPTDDLGPQTLRVHEALRVDQGQSAGEIAVSAGIPLDRARVLLTELEGGGFASRLGQGWVRTRVRQESAEARVSAQAECQRAEG
ncbi:DNA processing protein [Tamaricihabitans halophyticus]|uniref:DNA processing protein n=1 Tax=Tamaricihabitans halophyticus TaxID=1262583 RepID=A0A4R2QXY4_9PSEU|nr:DNA-processing protein DprA [Tamaricihabitans halophyticus]TCP51961.1 DNA processing protein [Tamaricihabitans halophyticus]